MDSLLRRYPAKPINPDRSVFDLPLELRDGKATALRISLPPHFPQERPSLSMLLPVVHPAVDSTGRLHTPGLANWVYGQSSLADAVAEAVATLTSAVVDARQPGAQATGGGRIGELAPAWWGVSAYISVCREERTAEGLVRVQAGLMRGHAHWLRSTKPARVP